MHPDELQQTLTELHDELSRTSFVDEATRRRLAELIPDIQRLVEKTEPVPTVDQAASPSRTAEPTLLMQHLREAIERFEAHHPKLTATLQQIVDRLSEIGI